MLSPRTMSLRTKSRALLKAIDNYAAVTSQKNFHEINFDGINHHSTIVELDCPLQQAFTSSYSSEFISHEFPSKGSNSCDTHSLMKESDLASARASKEKGQCLLKDEDHTSGLESKLKIDPLITLSKELQTRAPKMISMGRNKAWKQESSSTDSVFTKSMGQVNTKKSRNQRSKSVFLEQERAAEAQMHAPTHSHSTSRCYCTNKNYARVQPDKRYVVQVHGHKQHIPDRLKRSRYRADSIPMQSKSIKWADYDENIIHLQPNNVPLLPLSGSCKVNKDCCDSPRSISNQSAHGSHASQSSLLDKVKMFRESHWSDCHASREGMLSLHHNCAFHYVPNKRLFLEPVHINDSGEDSCPVCILPSGDFKMSSQQGTQSTNDKTDEDQSKTIMVTLPVHMLEPEFHGGKTIFKASFHKDKRERCLPKKESCFNVQHHKWDTQTSFCKPTDSLALRFQKKAC